jgi:hypothetical protein
MTDGRTRVLQVGVVSDDEGPNLFWNIGGNALHKTSNPTNCRYE